METPETGGETLEKADVGLLARIDTKTDNEIANLPDGELEGALDEIAQGEDKANRIGGKHMRTAQEALDAYEAEKNRDKSEDTWYLNTSEAGKMAKYLLGIAKEDVAGDIAVLKGEKKKVERLAEAYANWSTISQ